MLFRSAHPQNFAETFKDPLHPKNSALQRVAYLCIHMSVDGYLWIGFNSAEQLSSTCRTTNMTWLNNVELC